MRARGSYTRPGDRRPIWTLHFLTPYVAAMLKDIPTLLRQEMELHFMTKSEDAST